MVEEARQGRDVAILEVVMEAAGPLKCGQLEGLGACARQMHPGATRPSRPPIALALQLPVVVG